jgi:magnesium-transporting ATPase (P-type)
MSAFFGLFIFMSIFNCFNARTHRINIFANILKNKVFLITIIMIAIIQVIMIYYGGTLFRTIGLTYQEFFIMLGIALSVIPFDWVRKITLRLNHNKEGV